MNTHYHDNHRPDANHAATLRALVVIQQLKACRRNPAVADVSNQLRSTRYRSDRFLVRQSKHRAPYEYHNP